MATEGTSQLKLIPQEKIKMWKANNNNADKRPCEFLEEVKVIEDGLFNILLKKIGEREITLIKCSNRNYMFSDVYFVYKGCF